MKVGFGRPTGPAPPTTAQSAVPEHGFAASLERLLGGTLDPPNRPAGPVAEAPPDGGVRFSRHASARLQSRGVDLPPDDLRRLGEAVDRLDERGARESLVLLGDHAFVVGVPSRTVVTVMPRADALGTVFTNIDSTFVAN